MEQDQLAMLEDGGRVTRSRETPIFPEVYEPAALYLAIAYAMRTQAFAAPDQVLDRLRELGWLKSVRPRVSPAHGPGFMDCCGVAWLDLELVKRIKKDKGESFVREVLALQLASA